MNHLDGESSYVREVRLLVSKINDTTSGRMAFVEQATEYFANQVKRREQYQQLETEVARCEQMLAGSQKGNEAWERKLTVAKQNQKQFVEQVESERLGRYSELAGLCDLILQLTEGENFDETNRKSSKLLATLQLMAPFSSGGDALCRYNARVKELYKAVLCLRLLDCLLLDGHIRHPYVERVINSENGDVDIRSAAAQGQSNFRQQLQIPLMMAVFLQDIGLHHPDARKILQGDDGELDPFRLLQHDERSELLKISYRESYHYASNGIGINTYTGHSKEERARFIVQEKDKLEFVKTLLKEWVSPQDGIGNLLKVCQVYTSVIMSTKSGYSYKSAPKVYELMQQKAQSGVLNTIAVDALLRITGKFPPGFGITYIPKDPDGQDLNRYEYAIVIGFYPEHPLTPICRMATKNMLFVSYGNMCRIHMGNNLFFEPARQKLEMVGKERLLEIERLLSSNYKEKRELEYIPSCWDPGDYFSLKKNQNLWNSNITVTI